MADGSRPTDGLRVRRPAASGFRPDIEGLRAVAVLAVVLYHGEVPGVGGGFVGVDVFFVISGFLITGLLWREVSHTGTVGLRRFYGARARRLLPASATVGIVTLIASVILLPPLQARIAIGDGIASAVYVSNYWFILRNVNYFASLLPSPSPFQHYWSLGVEEQFYLVWPPMIIGTAWLIRLVRRRTRTPDTAGNRPYLMVLTLIAAISFTLSLAITYWAPFVAFFSLPTRAWELAFGGLVLLTTDTWRRLPPRAAALTGSIGLGVILLACIRLSSTTPYPGSAVLLPVVGAVLVIGAGCSLPSQGCARFLGSSPMRAVGRISYSWYLWHWPVFVLTPAWLGHPMGLAGRLAAAMASCGLAVVTMRVIENPLRFAAPLRRSPLASLAVGGAATAIAVAVGVVLPHWIPVLIPHGPAARPLTVTATPPAPGSNIGAYDAAVQRAFTQVQAAVAASADLKAVPSNLDPPLAAAARRNPVALSGCLRMPFQGGQQPECATGDTASPITVALVGDSHAAMWNPAFQQVAEQQHWRLETLAKGACPLMDIPIPDNFLRRLIEHYQHCERWRTEIIARLRAERPRLVVVGLWRGYGADESWTGFMPYDSVWNQSLNRLVGQLRATGTKVLVIGPTPAPHSVASFCLSSHLDDAGACSPPKSKAVNEPGIAAESEATKTGGGQYADVTELFCTADRCPAIIGNTLVYSDVSHLTDQCSRLLAPAMGALAARALDYG